MDNWVGAALVGVLLAGSASIAEAQAPVEKGLQVYTAQKCVICHSIGGKGNAKGVLDGVGTKLSSD